MKMEKLMLVISLLGLAAAADIRTTTIGGAIRFYFDHTVNDLVAATDSKCYIVPLTYAEADHVHTSGGLEELELRMMREWMGTLPEKSVYHTDRAVPPLIQQWCTRRDMIYLARADFNPSSTTPVSPLGKR
ncbi:uncharacterized protein LOC128233559 [Mya arenaria]|uniref:uncharacterized protein LOC128233559 n=1 Tax=Mya arenaria TaxID=6604 RepID=UPI0022E2CC80|nr:uncharacterized protein LOC128233559 [Mya arenaria]